MSRPRWSGSYPQPQEVRSWPLRRSPGTRCIGRPTCCSPTAASRICGPRVRRTPAKVTTRGGGVGGGQPPVDLGGVLAGGQGLVPAAGVGQPDGEVVQRRREGGFVGGGVGGGQPPVDLDGVLDGGQALFPAAGLTQPVREVV